MKKTVGTSSTTYIGSLYEVESDGKIAKHIFAGANRVATSLRGSAAGATEAISYYHSDHLGSSNVITDVTGAQAGLTEFSPYGSVFKQTGSYDPKFKFTGKELDNTGLYFYGARYYDPQLGRFITADTIVQSPYDPQSLNRYSYCRNNPVNYIDPTGHWSWKKFLNAAAGALVAVALTIVLGPAGFGMSMAMAGMWGGMAGGALTGGLEGGWKGALIGAGMGAITGGIGGWAYGGGHTFVMGGMFAAGVGMAAATDSWDSFAGGFVGGLCGAAAGGGITSAYKQQFANYRAGNGFTNSVNTPSEALRVDIKKGYEDLKNTEWVKTSDGKLVLKNVNEAINKGNVSVNDLPPGTRADYNLGKIRLNSEISQNEVPGRLAHEGTHMLQHRKGELKIYDFPDERAAFNAGYAVDSETNVYGAYNPTDNEIRAWYEPYFDK